MSKVNLDSRESGGLATLTLVGPPDKWFALSLGSPHFDMADKPYTIVVDGKGNVQERKLGDHDPGQVLTASLRVLSNSVMDGQRQVVVSRPFKGHTADHFTFDPSTSTIPVLAASGNGPNFAYHGAKQRTGGRLQLSGVDSPTCLCDTGRKGSIEGIPFNKHCLDEPFGDLVQQKNPTCWIETYQGGQVVMIFVTALVSGVLPPRHSAPGRRPEATRGDTDLPPQVQVLLPGRTKLQHVNAQWGVAQHTTTNIFEYHLLSLPQQSSVINYQLLPSMIKDP